MKRFYLLALVAAMFAACSTDATEDVAIEAPETLKVSFEESTRIQLDDNKTVWTKGDLVSVFYRSDANQQWKFQGKTGDREGILKRVSAPEATEKLSKIVAVYPYRDNYYINPETCNIEATLPAEQTYLKDSYGLDGNLLVSATEFNQLYLRNVCGWLKIQLKGEGQVVKKITLKGNNGEQVAGLIYVDSSDATATLAAERSAGGDDGVGGTLVFEDTIHTEVALNCPNGVTLGSESTAFYIALPPQTFEKGLTVDITSTNGITMSQTTDKALVIERNTIQPMAEFEYKVIPDNEIWYTSIDGNIVTPRNSNAFDANILSNTYKNGIGIIKFDKEITEIGNTAFYDNESIVSIIMPNGVTSIGQYAFTSCDNLIKVSLPKNLLTIGVRAFYFCLKLMDVKIPDSVTTIKYGAFLQCESFTKAHIPNSVTTIEESAFSYCSNLKQFDGKFASNDGLCLITGNTLNSFATGSGASSYIVPDYITDIGDFAFMGTQSLTNITIGSNIKRIGWHTFCNCIGLVSIVFPSSVSTIEARAFIGCTSLKSVYCKSTIPPSGSSGMFDDNASGRKIYVPRASVDAYKTASYWSNYKSDIEPYDF